MSVSRRRSCGRRAADPALSGRGRSFEERYGYTHKKQAAHREVQHVHPGHEGTLHTLTLAPANGSETIVAVTTAVAMATEVTFAEFRTRLRIADTTPCRFPSAEANMEAEFGEPNRPVPAL